VRERLRVGLCERVACSRIATPLSTWGQTHADADLQIVSRSGRALLTEIEGGLLDAGITAMYITEAGMVTDRLWTDPWLAALPKGHTLAQGRALELADLAREPLAVLAPDPSGTDDRQIFEHRPTVDSPLFIAERPTTALALMTWVEARCGMGLLTTTQGEGVAHPNVILRPLRRGLPPVEIHLLRSDAPASPRPFSQG